MEVTGTPCREHRDAARAGGHFHRSSDIVTASASIYSQFSVVTARYAGGSKILQKSLKWSEVFTGRMSLFWGPNSFLVHKPILSHLSLLLSLPQLPRTVAHSFVNADTYNTIYMLMRESDVYHHSTNSTAAQLAARIPASEEPSTALRISQFIGKAHSISDSNAVCHTVDVNVKFQRASSDWLSAQCKTSFQTFGDDFFHAAAEM